MLDFSSSIWYYNSTRYITRKPRGEKMINQIIDEYNKCYSESITIEEKALKAIQENDMEKLDIILHHLNGTIQAMIELQKEIFKKI